jgi:uncharacterized delta-60 repeat protein
MSSKKSRAARRARRNIFELQDLEVRRFLTLTTHSVDGSNTLQLIGTSSSESVTVNKPSTSLVVTDVTNGVTTTFTFSVGNSAGQVNKINIQMSGGNDTVLITSSVKNGTAGIPVTVAGNDGNDNITTGPGNDVLSGGNGNDTMDGGVGNDLMTGGANTDTTNYSNRTGALRITLESAANDGEVGIGEADNVQTEEVIGGAGNDTITGSSLQDFLGGGGGADSLTGGSGNDELIGSSGSDKMFGQNGDDYLHAQNNDQDTVNGGTNTDGTADFDAAEVDGIDVPGPTVKTPAPPPANPADLDTSYGQFQGKAASFTDWNGVGGSAVDAQGRVYFVGRKSAVDNDVLGQDMVVSRFDPNGNLDTGFGYNGETLIDFTAFNGTGYGYNDDDVASGITLDADGNIIVVGRTTPSFGNARFAIARLLPTGALDTSFNDGGLQTVAIDGFAGAGYGDSDAVDAAVQLDGKIVVAGNYSNVNGVDVAVARLLGDGRIDNSDNDPTGSFNGTGQNFRFRSFSNDYAKAVALQTFAGGVQRIVVANDISEDSDSGWNVGLTFFDANGSLSNVNDGTGSTDTDFGGAEHVHDVTVNSSNQIIVAGEVDGPFIGSAAPVQDGTVDGLLAVWSDPDSAPSFVDQPPLSGQFGTLSYNAVTTDSANRILVAGYEDGDFAVARYTPSLNLDTSFGGGIVQTDFFESDESALSIRELPDHSILVGGQRAFMEGGPALLAAKYIGQLQGAEAEITGIETFVNYDQNQQDPPPPPLDKWFPFMSDGAKLYARSQPDENGIARINLGDGNDNVQIYLVTAGDGKQNVAVNVNGLVLYYDVATTTRIVIHGNHGNDTMVAAANVPTQLVLDGAWDNDSLVGGAGNDVIQGGGGNDTCVGQGGNDAIDGGNLNDVILGGEGFDVLIGGIGSDKINGDGGEDILVAGATAWNENATALGALALEWGNTAHPNAQRINFIRNGGGLNGSFVLRTGTGATVFDDAAADSLTGGAARDWFFYKATNPNKDSILDSFTGEEVNTL